MTRTRKTGVKPSEYIKTHGFKSIKELSEISGVGSQTLIDWYDNERRFKLLNLVIRGALFERGQQNDQSA